MQPSGVFVWDPVAERFLSFTPGAPSFVNDLDELSLGDGLWIDIEGGSAVWTQPALGEARDVSLVAGLPIAIWTGPDRTAIEDAIAGIAGAVAQILTWNAATQSFNSFNAALPAAFNTLATLNHGDAFWIEVTSAVIWSQPPP